jgi:hypothetical protein
MIAGSSLNGRCAVLDVVFPASDEAAEVVHPGEEAFYLPTSAVAAQRGGILFRQLTSLRPGAQHLQHAMQYGTRVVPRTAALIGPALRSQHRLHHFPLFVGQLPTATHRHIRRSAEHLQSATKPLFSYL